MNHLMSLYNDTKDFFDGKKIAVRSEFGPTLLL